MMRRKVKEAGSKTAGRFTAISVGLLGCSFLLCIGSVRGEIVTDAKFSGKQVRLNATNMTIDQALGKTKGNNLFHSFQVFDVNKGQTATFTGSNIIKNVISRVTGKQPSKINGLIKSEIGKADFYFINPNGVVFGEDSVVDVPGAFHVSTANALNFKDGKVFSATHSRNASSLTASAPQSFGFLGGQQQALVKLTIKNTDVFSPLSNKLSTTKKVSFIGSNIEINNSNIVLDSGQIRFDAVGDSAMQVPINKSVVGILRDNRFTGIITIKGGTEIKTSGKKGGGGLIIQSGRLMITDSTISSNHMGNNNNGNRQGVHIGVRDAFTLNQSSIDSSTEGMGNAGNISIDAGNIYINGGSVGSTVQSRSLCENIEGCGNSGKVTVTSRGNLELLNNSSIDSSTESNGSAGGAVVHAKNITIDGTGSSILSDASCKSNTNACQGNAGIIWVTADELLKINNHARISSISDHSQGNGSDVIVRAKNMVLEGNSGQGDRTGIFSDSFSTSDYKKHGKAGKTNVLVRQTLRMRKGAIISSSTFTNSNAGQVKAQAKSIDIQDENTGILSQSDCDRCSGNAGNVTVIADDILLGNNAGIRTSSKQTNGGAVVVNGDIIRLNNGRITTSSGNGNGGDITISGDALVLNGGFIQANAKGDSKKGGIVTIKTDTLLASHGQLQIGGENRDLQLSYNAIQSASPNGESGTINSTAPELNINGSMLNLKSDLLPSPDLNASPCAIGKGSSLIQMGWGGLPQKSNDSVYIPNHRITENQYNIFKVGVADGIRHNMSICTQSGNN